jgi:phosphopantetheinyl transferase (holo-ACP synthase)
MSLISAGANFLFLDPNSGYKIGSRFLTIVMKKEMSKMGINSVRFTAYSIKHSAVSFLVKKGMSVEEIERAMHYKQKNSTIMTNYAVKEATKKASLMLASAADVSDIPKVPSPKIEECSDSEVKEA